MEIDYIIQSQGVSLFSPRLKGGERYVAFDKPETFGPSSMIRIRARNKLLNIPVHRELTGNDEGDVNTAINANQNPTLEVKQENAGMGGEG